MWYWGPALSLISKITMEGINIPPAMYEKFENILGKVDKNLELLGGIDPDNPITWALTLNKVIKNSLNNSALYDYSEEYLVANGYKRQNDFFEFNSSIVNNLKSICKYRSIFKSDHENNKIFLFEHEDIQGHFCFEVENSSFFKLWTLPDFDLEQITFLLSKVFWNDRECLFLDRVPDGYGTNSATLPFSLDEYEYWGELSKIIERWPKYREQKIRRTALVHGRPGMGKTTFSYWLAKNLSKKTLLLSPMYVYSLNVNKWLTLCKVAQPEMVVFQDIHTIDSDSLMALLEAFEEKTGDNVPFIPYIVCTANDFEYVPEALLRPGRLGDEIYLLDEAPEPHVIDNILNNFLSQLELTLDEKHRPFFHKVYIEGNASLVKELFKRMKVEGESALEATDIKSVFDLKEVHDEEE